MRGPSSLQRIMPLRHTLLLLRPLQILINGRHEPRKIRSLTSPLPSPQMILGTRWMLTQS